MAEGRVLRKKISVDERVAQLSAESALLYTWAIAHADVAGRLEGSPVALKATIVPLRDWTISHVDQLADAWMHTKGSDGKERPLAIRYVVKGKIICQLTGWANNYNGRPDREAKSTLAPFNPKSPAYYVVPGALPDNAGTTPARGVGFGIEGKGKDGSRENPFQGGFLSTTRSEETGGGGDAYPMNGASPAYRKDPVWIEALTWVEADGWHLSPIDVIAYIRDYYGLEEEPAITELVARAVQLHQEATT